MRKIHFSDFLESTIADALDNAKINFVHESENSGQILDFYLPNFDVYIEVKQFHSDRISKQMILRDNVIAVQGIKSVRFLEAILLKLKTDNP